MKGKRFASTLLAAIFMFVVDGDSASSYTPDKKPASVQKLNILDRAYSVFSEKAKDLRVNLFRDGHIDPFYDREISRDRHKLKVRAYIDSKSAHDKNYYETTFREASENLNSNFGITLDWKIEEERFELPAFNITWSALSKFEEHLEKQGPLDDAVYALFFKDMIYFDFVVGSINKIGGNKIVVDEVMDPDYAAQILLHELGHSFDLNFGIRHSSHHPKKEYLMYYASTSTNWSKESKRQILDKLEDGSLNHVYPVK